MIIYEFDPDTGYLRSVASISVDALSNEVMERDNLTLVAPPQGVLDRDAYGFVIVAPEMAKWDKVGKCWVAVPPTPEELATQMLAHVDAHLKATANSRGYDSIDSAAKYIGNILNPLWAAEGDALRDWAILVYAKCYEIQADVMAGNIPIPTTEELIAMLPEMVWPDDET